MTPDEIPEADALSAAARTIGQMPEEAVRSKFAQLQQMRKARTEREIIRQQAETDSLDGDEAAYQAGLMYEKSDLKKAARWYRAAAVNDFPGAAFDLMEELNARLDPEYRRPQPGSGSPGDRPVHPRRPDEGNSDAERGHGRASEVLQLRQGRES